LGQTGVMNVELSEADIEQMNIMMDGHRVRNDLVTAFTFVPYKNEISHGNHVN
jgi:hypothetical protein